MKKLSLIVGLVFFGMNPTFLHAGDAVEVQATEKQKEALDKCTTMRPGAWCERKQGAKCKRDCTACVKKIKIPSLSGRGVGGATLEETITKKVDAYEKVLEKCKESAKENVPAPSAN